MTDEKKTWHACVLLECCGVVAGNEAVIPNFYTVEMLTYSGGTNFISIEKRQFTEQSVRVAMGSDNLFPLSIAHDAHDAFLSKRIWTNFDRIMTVPETAVYMSRSCEEGQLWESRRYLVDVHSLQQNLHRTIDRSTLPYLPAVLIPILVAYAMPFATK